MPYSGPAIGVFGHYGNENLGDEAIIEALIARLRRTFPGARIVAFSIRPHDTGARHGVPAFPIRFGGDPLTGSNGRSDSSDAGSGGAARRSRIGKLLRWGRLRRLRHIGGRTLRAARAIRREIDFLARSYRRVRGLDVLIIAGSNQFLDNFGGPWAFPYTLLKWSILARLAGCRVYIVSIGAGPLDSRLSMAMVRACLALADYVSFRDVGSRRLVLGTRSSADAWPVYPDLAHSLELSGVRGRARARLHERPRVGINPMPLYDDRYWCAPDRTRYRWFVHQLAAFAHRLLREGYPVIFFSTQPKDITVAHDIRAAMAAIDPSRGGPPPEICRPSTTQELMSAIDAVDVVVATRFHGVLLSLHAWKPVLAICYHRKTLELMQAVQQERYAVNLDDLDAEDLWTRFKELEARASEERQRLETLESTQRDALEQQYAVLLQRFEQAGGVLKPAA